MRLAFIRTLIDRDVVESTSDLAKQLVAEEAVALPLAVRSARQTRGRGRGNHVWWSDEGSLTFSLALDPAAHALRPEHEPRLALATAVAIIDAIGEFALRGPLGIRWPNDVEVAGKKLGGVLPERVETARGVCLVIGIGLNVTTCLDRAPDEVRRMATSLAERSASPLGPETLERVFGAILRAIEHVLSRLTGDDPSLSARWAELDTLRETWVRIDLGERVVSGWGRGIDPEGALCLASEQGVLRIFGGQVLRNG